MMLADYGIRKQIQNGSLGVEPFVEENLQPASLDVRLDDVVLGYCSSQGVVDPKVDQSHKLYSVDLTRGPTFILRPGQLVLGATVERFKIPGDLAARVEGKSSLGRLGLQVHSTAGFIDPGFCGQITLELSVCGEEPFVLHAGMNIAQVCFYRLETPVERLYGDPSLGSHYQGQMGATPSKSFQL